MQLSPLHERLHSVIGNRTYRAIAELTGTNAETCRRYVLGQDPSVEFLTAICQRTGTAFEWLLTGHGPMRAEHVRAHALKEAAASELLGAMARTIERLIDRVERLELYCHTLETRLRADRPPPRSVAPADHTDAKTQAISAPIPDAAPRVTARARSIARAVPKRARPSPD